MDRKHESPTPLESRPDRAHGSLRILGTPAGARPQPERKDTPEPAPSGVLRTEWLPYARSRLRILAMWAANLGANRTASRLPRTR